MSHTPTQIEQALLWAAGYELNAIHARDGAPSGVSEEYFGDLVDAIRGALGGDIKPWPEQWMRPILQEFPHAEHIPAHVRAPDLKAENERLKASNAGLLEALKKIERMRMFSPAAIAVREVARDAIQKARAS